MLQNNEKSAEVLKAEKIVEQAKARLAEAKRKASQQKRKEENQHKYMISQLYCYLRNGWLGKTRSGNTQTGLQRTVFTFR